MTRKKWVEPELREVADLPEVWATQQCFPGASLGGPCAGGGIDMPMGCINGNGDFNVCTPGSGVAT